MSGGQSEVGITVLRLAFAVALYAALVVVLFFTVQDMRQHAAAVTRRVGRLMGGGAGRAAPPVARLEAVSVGDSGAPGSVPLRSRLEIGSAADCGLVISGDDVSPRHARLGVMNGRWWLTDLESASGTFVGDRRISQPTQVGDGTNIRIGPATYRLVLAD